MAEQSDIRAALQSLLLSSARAEGWLAQERLFADKGRAITSSEVVALRLEPSPEGTLALVIVQFRFADDAISRYFIPLLLATTFDETAVPLGRIVGDLVLDAAAQPWSAQ